MSDSSVVIASSGTGRPPLEAVIYENSVEYDGSYRWLLPPLIHPPHVQIPLSKQALDLTSLSVAFRWHVRCALPI